MKQYTNAFMLFTLNSSVYIMHTHTGIMYSMSHKDMSSSEQVSQLTEQEILY